ncbi:MAG: hypothetical protein OK452_01400 [Thaumarchaeota archaeon]|nr:hypothetical protein [Nitrososphaerota archaeon]
MAGGRELLSDKDVKRWHDNLLKGSHWTGRNWLYNLSAYSKYRNLPPKALIEEFRTDKKAGQDALEDYLNQLALDKKAPSTIKAALDAFRSFLRHFELSVTREINIKDIGTNPTIADERTPERADFERVLNQADVRTRTILSCISLGGIRYESMSGLVLRDLVEFDMATCKALKTPMRVNIRKENSKNRKPYFTFIQRPEYLEAYMAERKSWDTLTPSSHVFVAQRTSGKRDGGRVTKGDPLGSGALSMEVRRAMRVAGLTQRPYVWRAFYDSALLEGRINSEIQYFIMGHTGTIEATYTTRKNLSEKQVDDIRAEYSKVFTTPIPLDEDRVMAIVEERVQKVIARHLEETGREIDDDLRQEVQEGMSKAVREGLEEFPMDKENQPEATPKLLKELVKNGTGTYDVKVVSKTDEKGILSLLEDGFSWVQDLGAGRAVYRKKKE